MVEATDHIEIPIGNFYAFCDCATANIAQNITVEEVMRLGLEIVEEGAKRYLLIEK